MKKKIALFSTLLMLVSAMLCLSACGDDKDDEKATEGVWYLVAYGSNNNECDWGEYMAFNDGALVWGQRDRGTKTSSFSFTSDGKKIICVPIDGYSEPIIFTIESVSKDKMTTTSTDDIRRHWRR